MPETQRGQNRSTGSGSNSAPSHCPPPRPRPVSPIGRRVGLRGKDLPSPSGSGAKLHLGGRTKPWPDQTEELEPALGQSQDPETIAMSHQLAPVPGTCVAAAQARLGLHAVTAPAPPLGLRVSALTRLTPNALCTLASSCLEVYPGTTEETSEPESDLPPLIFLGFAQLFGNSLSRSG